MIKPTTLLSLSAALVLGSMAATSIGCSAPPVQSFEQEVDEDEDEGKTTPKKKTTPAKNTTTNNPAPAPAGNTTPPPASTTPPPATPPPATPPPGGDPMACMDLCVATGAAAQYWTCSANCQDRQCDDTCWSQSCAQNEQACGQALDTCDQKCSGGQPQDPNAP